jgi:hypothetical protein
MSGYPLKSVHDSVKKRKEYQQELALRAKLDDINLQANKLYKRTGAISALPDTRTTSEKLADLYRLRIDIYDKLKTIMSGDDAQKTINGLSADEIRFISQRLDKIIKYFKGKYKLGVPYQVFNDYLQKSIEAMNVLGDDNVDNLALVENMVSKDDFNSALSTMMQQYSTAEQNKLRGAIRFYEGLTNEIRQTQRLVSSTILDVQSQIDLTRLISDISSKIPNNTTIDNLLLEYQTAISYSDTKAIDDLKLKIDSLIADIASLQNDKQDLETRLEDAIRDNQLSQATYQLIAPSEQQLAQPAIPTSTQTIYKTSGSYTYIPPNEVLDKSLWPRKSTTYADLSGYIIATYNLLPDKQMWSNKGGVSLNTMSTNWSAQKLRNWIVDNDDLFKQAWTDKTISSVPQITPTEQQTGIDVGNLFSLPSQLPDELKLKNVADSLGINVKDITSLIISVRDDLLASGVQIPSSFMIDVKNVVENLPSTQVYQNSSKTLSEISAYVMDWIQNLRTDQNISLADYINNRTISGNGIMSKVAKKSSKMKGKGVSIDFDAGIKSDNKKQSNYVPFGKFIINRKKLEDGIIMIKRPNGAFMGELQSRMVGSKLKNVFEKIVGGSVPSFNDYNKLDADEIEYLHYVSKKANLLDKLDVPSPKKDDDEKMMHRFEVLRGQLMAGQDNKQMISEFKKLILDMTDKKLLPRRQVSDILIDIEKMYG